MTLQTYDDLIATATDWLMRDDIAPALPAMIRLAESDMNRRLRLACMVKNATITALDGAAPLPTDCLEIRTVSTDTGTLTFLPPVQYSDFVFRSGTIPAHYTIQGNELLAHPSAGDIRISYYASLPPLSPDQPSNAVLIQHPDLYLYSTLLASAPYLQDDQRGLVWKTLYDEGVLRAEEADDRSEFAGHLIIRAD